MLALTFLGSFKVLADERTRRLGQEDEENDGAEGGGHNRHGQKVGPTIDGAQQLAQAEQLGNENAYGGEELMQDADATA